MAYWTENMNTRETLHTRTEMIFLLYFRTDFKFT